MREDLNELWLGLAHQQCALTRMAVALLSTACCLGLLYVCLFVQGCWQCWALAVVAAAVVVVCVATSMRIFAHTAYLRDDGRWRVDCAGLDEGCVNHVRWLRVSNSQARLQYFLEDQWNHTPEQCVHKA